MSLSTGNYTIFSRVLDGTGAKLAITYTGVNQYPTVQPLGSPPPQAQVWSLQSASGSFFTVTPLGITGYRVGWGGQGIEVLPAGAFVWSFNNNAEGFVIQDGSLTENWFIGSANSGQKIQIANDNGQPFHRWIINRV